MRILPANPGDFAADFNFNTEYYVDFSRVASPVVTINDDDIAGVSITPTTTLTVTEGGEPETYTVVLDSDPGGDVTVAITMGTSTTAPITVESTPALPLTFTSENWDTPQSVTVTATEDVDQLGGLRTLMHTVTGYGDVATAESVTVEVLDNDIPGVTLSETTLTVTEEETAETYEVVLNTMPDSDVTVTIVIVPDIISTTAPIAVTLGTGAPGSPGSHVYFDHLGRSSNRHRGGHRGCRCAGRHAGPGAYGERLYGSDHRGIGYGDGQRQRHGRGDPSPRPP